MFTYLSCFFFSFDLNDIPTRLHWAIEMTHPLSFSSTSSQNYDVAIPIDETDDDQLLSLLIKQANLSIIQTFKPTSHPKVRERGF